MYTRENVRRGNALFLLIICAYMVVNVGVSLITDLFHIKLSYVELILIAQIGYAAPAIWYACRKKQPLAEIIRFRKTNVITVLLLVLFAFSIMPLMNLISILSLLVGKNFIQSTVSGLITQTNIVVCLLAIGILPAVMEEFVYRGVIYNEQRQGGTLKAILCTGLFFGLLHMNINQFSYAFIIGIVLAFTVEATGTILGSMIVHATINGHSVILSWTQSKVASGGTMSATETLTRGKIIEMLPAYTGATLVATLFAAFLFFLIVKINKREEAIKQIFTRSENGETTRFVDGYFIIAVLITVIFMISREFS